MNLNTGPHTLVDSQRSEWQTVDPTRPTLPLSTTLFVERWIDRTRKRDVNPECHQPEEFTATQRGSRSQNSVRFRRSEEYWIKILKMSSWRRLKMTTISRSSKSSSSFVFPHWRPSVLSNLSIETSDRRFVWLWRYTKDGHIKDKYRLRHP